MVPCNPTQFKHTCKFHCSVKQTRYCLRPNVNLKHTQTVVSVPFVFEFTGIKTYIYQEIRFGQDKSRRSNKYAAMANWSHSFKFRLHKIFADLLLSKASLKAKRKAFHYLLISYLFHRYDWLS